MLDTPAEQTTFSKVLVWARTNVGLIIGLFIIALITAIPALVYFFKPSIDAKASLALLLGSLVFVCGYYHLIYLLPKMMKDMETRISMEALRASFWLVVFGLIIIILGFLYLMNLLPP